MDIIEIFGYARNAIFKECEQKQRVEAKQHRLRLLEALTHIEKEYKAFRTLIELVDQVRKL